MLHFDELTLCTTDESEGGDCVVRLIEVSKVSLQISLYLLLSRYLSGSAAYVSVLILPPSVRREVKEPSELLLFLLLLLFQMFSKVKKNLCR